MTIIDTPQENTSLKKLRNAVRKVVDDSRFGSLVYDNLEYCTDAAEQIHIQSRFSEFCKFLVDSNSLQKSVKDECQDFIHEIENLPFLCQIIL